MNLRFVINCAMVLSAAGSLYGQAVSRRAAMVGGGSENRGKCTVEVVVDGAAEISISGDRATLRNLRGQMPQWRRFECSGIMPSRPGDFRFQGVDGRGSQTLVRDPQNGGPAVIQIQDSDNGSEGYTFDIFWGNQVNSYDRGGDYGGYAPVPDRGYDRGGYNSDRSYDHGNDDRYRRAPVSRDPVLNCQEAVRLEAEDRFRVRDLNFRRVAIDDRRGSRDVVQGTADSRQGRTSFRFSCTVDPRDGAVRSVDLREAR